MAIQRPQFSLKNLKPKSFDPATDLVKKEPLTEKGFPMLYRPAVEGIILKDWFAGHLPEIEKELQETGAILFRGFDIPTRDAFQDVIRQFGHDFLSYKDRSSPRSEIKENIYNSTEHPSDQVINMHTELSYSHTWPLKIAFYCYKEPDEGGETPIADVRKVLHRLSGPARQAFGEKGIRYRRLLQPGIGLPWQEVYQTTEKAVVEQYCASHQLEYTWLENDSLEIKWYRPAIRLHPATGEEVWFNHGFFFNAQALPREIMAAFPDAEELPFNTYYGDGSPIPAAYIEEIRDAYQQESVFFPWKHGDILLMDNMLSAHGRNAYKGDREINVVMIQACN